MTTTLSRRGRGAQALTFAAAAEAHLDDVLGYLVYMTGDRHLADDLTAATFEKALRLWRRFDPRRASARTRCARAATSGRRASWKGSRRGSSAPCAASAPASAR